MHRCAKYKRLWPYGFLSKNGKVWPFSFFVSLNWSDLITKYGNCHIHTHAANTFKKLVITDDINYHETYHISSSIIQVAVGKMFYIALSKHIAYREHKKC